MRTLIDRPVNESETNVAWDGTNDNNEPVASGVYVVRFESGGQVQARRIVRLK